MDCKSSLIMDIMLMHILSKEKIMIIPYNNVICMLLLQYFYIIIFKITL